MTCRWTAGNSHPKHCALSAAAKFCKGARPGRPPSLPALTLFLALAAAAYPLFAGPLDETAPVLACPECSLITDAIAVPQGMVAVGERGLIAYRAPNGDWNQVPVPVRRMLTAVTRTGAGHLVAVGHDATVLTNTGSRANWTVLQVNPRQDMPLLDVWMAEDGSGFAVGAYGLVLATKDHGLSWSRQQVDPRESHFYSIRETPDGVLFIAGEFGTVFRSRDRGASWVRLDTGWDGTFFGLGISRAGRILLCGLEGAVLESRDGGQAWRSLDSGVSTSLYDIAFLPDDRAVIAGADGTVLAESAPGRFERIARAHRGAITAIVVTGPDSVLLFGEGGVHRQALQPNRPAGLDNER